jgi:hypothetical protein
MSSRISPYAGGSRPEGDLPNNGPPSACRSGNASEEGGNDDTKGVALVDGRDVDGAGECPVERLSGCNIISGLPFSDRLEGCDLLLAGVCGG